LAGARGRDRSAIGIPQADGDHRIALSLEFGDLESAEPGPGRRRARRDEARVAALGLALEQRLERRLPPGAEGGNAQRSEHLLARGPGEGEERADPGDLHLFRAGGELDDLVSRLDLALLEYSKVETGAAV